MMQRRSLAGLSIGVLGLCAAGCFPSLPGCDDDCNAPTTTGGPSTSDSPTLPPTSIDGTDPLGTATGSDTSTTGDGTTGSGSDSSGGSDSGGVTPLGPCETKMSPLTWNDVTLTVSNDLLTMHIDASSSYTPDLLSIAEGDDENVLYPGPSQDERFMGVLKYPENEASWQIDADHSFLEDGPVIFRMSSSWTTPSMQGTTTYAVVADGRIVRHEYVDNEIANGSHLTAYLALNPAGFDSVEWFGDLEGQADIGESGMWPPSFPLEAGPRDAVVSCAHGAAGNVIGFASHGSPVVGSFPGSAGAGARATISQLAGPDSFQFALQQDWIRDDGVPAPTIFESWLLTVVDGAEVEPCSCVAAHAYPFMEPAGLMDIVGGSVTGSAPGDTDGDGYNEELGAYDVSTIMNTPPYEFRIQGPYDLPSILRRMQDVVDISGITVGGVALSAGTDYLTQVAGDGWANTMWVLIRGPLPPNVSIEVDYVNP